MAAVTSILLASCALNTSGKGETDGGDPPPPEAPDAAEHAESTGDSDAADRADPGDEGGADEGEGEDGEGEDVGPDAPLDDGGDGGCTVPADCSSGDLCTGTWTCDPESRECVRIRPPLADGVACGAEPRRICRGGVCLPSTCGDGYVDAGGGEECEAGEGPFDCITDCGSSGSGPCAVGCRLPAGTSCPRPAEVCNGRDDDCDGLCDNGSPCCEGRPQECVADGCPGTRECGPGCLPGTCESSVSVCGADIQISDGADDAGMNGECSSSIGFANVYLGQCRLSADILPIYSGLRFPGVRVPRGAVVTEAHVSVIVDGPYSGAITADVYGEKVGDASPFVPGLDPTSLPLTDAKGTWVIPATDVWVSGQERSTPDLKTVIQEIVSLSDWDVGHSLALVFVGEAVGGAAVLHRRFMALERGLYRPALLHLSFRACSCP